MMKRHRILIPRGKPPFDLTPSGVPDSEEPTVEVKEEEESENMDLYTAMQEKQETGLSDGSDALEQAITGSPARPKASKTVLRKTAKSGRAGWKPEYFSDEDLKIWAQKCRDANDGWLLISALKYWLRYTFESYTPEYKELGKRLEKVVR